MIWTLVRIGHRGSRRSRLWRKMMFLGCPKWEARRKVPHSCPNQTSLKRRAAASSRVALVKMEGEVEATVRVTVTLQVAKTLQVATAVEATAAAVEVATVAAVEVIAEKVVKLPRRSSSSNLNRTRARSTLNKSRASPATAPALMLKSANHWKAIDTDSLTNSQNSLGFVKVS